MKRESLVIEWLIFNSLSMSLQMLFLGTDSNFSCACSMVSLVSKSQPGLKFLSLQLHILYLIFFVAL